MTWRNAPIENDPDGNPTCLGLIELVNDKAERLGIVLWFYEHGPFYASAVDLREPDVIRRIGPHHTLEGGKEAVMSVVEGRFDVSRRAGYLR